MSRSADVPVEPEDAQGEGVPVVATSGLRFSRRASLRRLRVWIVVAGLLGLGGIVGTVLVARSTARADGARSHQAFTQMSTQIVSTLRLAIQHERDLVVSAAAFDLGDPTASSADFDHWISDVHAFGRYPELSGIASIAFVPRSQLNAFEVRARAGGDGTFKISPPGIRPYYCFVTQSESRGATGGAALGADYCASVPQLMASRASGRGLDYAVRVGQLSKAPLLALETPMYRGGGDPATGVQRRSAFVGWIAVVVMPAVLLDSALDGHPDVAVALRSTTGSGVLAFSAGHAGEGAKSMTVGLKDGSTVQISAVVEGSGVFTDHNSRLLLIFGVLLSITLSLLVAVLAAGRWRAMRTVTEKTRQLIEKTEELSFQALHDGLTGLPNRALVIDRAELMLARARRQHTPTATMFVDVDGFKRINDTFGHAAGDEFLRIIAGRLSSVVRETDTVGRLGGDEFVVLLEGETLFAGPELVAERVLAVLRQPFELEDSKGRPQSASVSIGIAVGQRDSADELLRDADLALYQGSLRRL